MDWSIIILVILALAIVFYATRFVSKTVGAMTKVMIIMIILLGLLIFFFYKDITELKKGFSSERNTFILYGDGKVYTAVTLKPIRNNTFTLESFEYFYRSGATCELRQSLNTPILLDFPAKSVKYALIP